MSRRVIGRGRRGGRSVVSGDGRAVPEWFSNVLDDWLVLGEFGLCWIAFFRGQVHAQSKGFIDVVC